MNITCANLGVCVLNFLESHVICIFFEIKININIEGNKI